MFLLCFLNSGLLFHLSFQSQGSGQASRDPTPSPSPPMYDDLAVDKGSSGPFHWPNDVQGTVSLTPWFLRGEGGLNRATTTDGRPVGSIRPVPWSESGQAGPSASPPPSPPSLPRPASVQLTIGRLLASFVRFSFQHWLCFHRFPAFFNTWLTLNPLISLCWV